MPRYTKLAVVLMVFALLDAVLALAVLRAHPLLSVGVLMLCAVAVYVGVRRTLCGHCRAPLRGDRFVWVIDGKRRRVCVDCDLAFSRKKYAAFRQGGGA
jgi:hypothetical protein